MAGDTPLGTQSQSAGDCYSPARQKRRILAPINQEMQMHPTGDVSPRSEHSWRSAIGRLEEPLMPELDFFPRPQRGKMAISDGPSMRWVAGAVGAGLAQAATAISTRPDVGPVELSLAASAAAVGVRLYAVGVHQLMVDALEEPGADHLTSAAVAVGGLAGAIIGTGVASLPWPPGKIAGVALLVGATSAVHHALGRAFVAGEQALEQDAALLEDKHRHKQEATLAVYSLALMAGLGVGYAVYASPRLGAAEAAGLGLLCHALLGTAWSTSGVIRRWRAERSPAQPRITP